METNQKIVKLFVWILLALCLALLMTACESQDASSDITLTPQVIGAQQTLTDDPPVSTEEEESTAAEKVIVTETPVIITPEPLITTDKPAIVTEESAQVTDTSQPEDFEIVKGECGWRLTFKDEFEGDSLDTSQWHTGYKAGDRESQYYVGDVFEFEDGILKIRAEERQVKDRKYASGILTTQGIFEQHFGRFEVRAKAPAGKGLWPAFWMLPSSRNYPWEIDVFEILGHEPNMAYMSSHWPDESGNHDHKTEGFKGPDFSRDFHVFEVIWTPDKLVWLVDDVERHYREKHIPDEPMFLLLNLAVGGKWPGYPDDSTPFPSYLEVDYVRVYQWDCLQGSAE